MVTVPTRDPPPEPAGSPPAGTGPPAGGPSASGSRAGRHLGAAIAVGVGLGAVALVSLFTVRQAFVGVVAAFMAYGSWELARALRRGKGIRVSLVPVLAGGQAMVWLSWPFGREGLLTAFALTVLACLLWRIPAGADGYLRDVSASLFVLSYVPLAGGFGAMLVLPTDGSMRVLCFLLAVVASDIGGYATGVLAGRHPMAPTISPRKTWEGFAGSLAAGVLTGGLTVPLLLGGQAWQGVLFGVAIVVAATVGDLVESLVKRDLGIKDMGGLLPGHGGLMDRLDSLLSSALVGWLLLRAFVPL